MINKNTFACGMYMQLHRVIYPNRQNMSRKTWRRNHPEKEKAQQRRDLSKRDPTQHAARNKKWRQNNLERHRATDKVWRSCNHARLRYLNRRWRTANIATIREADRKRKPVRRAREHEAYISGPQWEITQIYARAAWWRSQGFNVQVDHIYPVGFGWHEPANLQIIYASENARKGANPDYKPRVVFV